MGELATDREHLALARAFVTVVAACPRYTGRKAADFDSKDVIRMLFTSIRSAPCPTATCLLLSNLLLYAAFNQASFQVRLHIDSTS